MGRTYEQDEALLAQRCVKQRAAVGTLGKHITRRSRGCCELCEDRDNTRPFELAPFPPEPDPERTLMACERCRDWLETGEVDVLEAHFLGTAAWSQKSPVRLAAARLLLAVNTLEARWLRDALEACGVDPTTLEFSEAA